MPTVKISRLPVLNNPVPAKAQTAEPAKVAPKKKTKRKGPRKIDDTTDLDLPNLNYTELLTLARRAEIPGASPAASREDLVRALETLTPIERPNPVDEVKKKLSSWMRRYWKKLRMQLPENIFYLLDKSDHQVALYYLKNKDQIT